MCWRADRGLTACEGEPVLLDIPDIRQAADYDCGAAALDAVARFHGIRERGPAKLCNVVQGMSPDMIEAWLRAVGLRVLSGSMTVDDLQHLTRTGRPVLCPTTLYGGHWVVVRGVERGRVHYHCPTIGANKMTFAWWLLHWRDATRAGHEFDRWGICPTR